MTDKLREAAQQALEALKETSVECAIEILEAALAQQDAQAVPQPPMLRWRELADYPAETGRYIVAHCGQVGGHAYYTAREGDTHYPVGWAQLPDFKPTHWLDGPRIGTGDAALNAAPTPPAQAVPQEQISDGEFDADKRLMELADKIDYEQNWRLSGIDQRDRLTQEQQDRVTAGVMLRRYADLMAPDSWRLFPPKHLSGGLHCFRAATLEKAVEMASRHIRLNAATAPLEQQGNPNPST